MKTSLVVAVLIIASCAYSQSSTENTSIPKSKQVRSAGVYTDSLNYGTAMPAGVHRDSILALSARSGVILDTLAAQRNRIAAQAESLLAHRTLLDSSFAILGSHTTTLGELTNVNAAQNDSITALRGQINKHIDSLAAHVGRLNAMADTLGAHLMRLNALAASIDTLTDEIGALDGTLSEAVDNIENNTSRIDSLEVSIAGLDSAISVLQESITELVDTSSLSQAVEGLEGEIEATRYPAWVAVQNDTIDFLQSRHYVEITASKQIIFANTNAGNDVVVTIDNPDCYEVLFPDNVSIPPYLSIECGKVSYAFRARGDSVYLAMAPPDTTTVLATKHDVRPVEMISEPQEEFIYWDESNRFLWTVTGTLTLIHTNTHKRPEGVSVYVHWRVPTGEDEKAPVEWTHTTDGGQTFNDVVWPWGVAPEIGDSGWVTLYDFQRLGDKVYGSIRGVYPPAEAAPPVIDTIPPTQPGLALHSAGVTSVTLQITKPVNQPEGDRTASYILKTSTQPINATGGGGGGGIVQTAWSRPFSGSIAAGSATGTITLPVAVDSNKTWIEFSSSFAGTADGEQSFSWVWASPTTLTLTRAASTGASAINVSGFAVTDSTHLITRTRRVQWSGTTQNVVVSGVFTKTKAWASIHTQGYLLPPSSYGGSSTSAIEFRTNDSLRIHIGGGTTAVYHTVQIGQHDSATVQHGSYAWSSGITSPVTITGLDPFFSNRSWFTSSLSTSTGSASGTLLSVVPGSDVLESSITSISLNRGSSTSAATIYYAIVSFPTTIASVQRDQFSWAAGTDSLTRTISAINSDASFITAGGWRYHGGYTTSTNWNRSNYATQLRFNSVTQVSAKRVGTSSGMTQPIQVITFQGVPDEVDSIAFDNATTVNPPPPAVESSDSTFLFTTAQASNTTMHYALKAVDLAGNVSVQSVNVPATTLSAPADTAIIHARGDAERWALDTIPAGFTGRYGLLNRVRRVSAPKYEGNYSMMFRVSPSVGSRSPDFQEHYRSMVGLLADTSQAYVNSNDLNSNDMVLFTPGQDYWVGFSVYLPGIDSLKNDEGTIVVWQSQAWADGGYYPTGDWGNVEGYKTTNPFSGFYRTGVLSMRLASGQWRVQVKGDNRRYCNCLYPSARPPGAPPEWTHQYTWNIGAWQRNTWTHFVYRMNYSHTGNGILQVWMNGTKVIDRSDLVMGSWDTNPSNNTIGNYWRYAETRPELPDSYIFIDNYRMANDKGSYDAVNPE